MALIALHTQAFDVVTSQFTAEYIFGEKDSRFDARNNAIAKIKAKALAASGSYVTTEKVLSGDKYTKKVSMISESVIKLTDIKEKYSSYGESLVLKMTATAHIDTSILDKRIKMLSDHKAKDQAIERLLKSNDDLYAQLDKLNKKLKLKYLSQTELAKLGLEQTRIKNYLFNNKSSVSAVFSKQILVQKEAESRTRYQQLVDKANKEFFEPLTTVIPEVVLQGAVKRLDGDYNVLVSVAWDLNQTIKTNAIFDAFLTPGEISKIQKQKKRETITTLTIPQPVKGKAIDHHSALGKYYNYLTKQTVDIEITLGGAVVRLPIYWLTAGKTHFIPTIKETNQCSRMVRLGLLKQLDKRRYICVKMVQSANKRVRTHRKFLDKYKQNGQSRDRLANPIPFVFTKEEYERLSDISVRVVRTDSTK